jgi:hypothetical protein
MQGEFAAKKYYEIILDHFSTELGCRGGHELLTLLAAHASKRMDCSTGVEPADQSCLGKIYQYGGNREIPRFRPTALDIAQAPPRLLLRISEFMPHCGNKYREPGVKRPSREPGRARESPDREPGRDRERPERPEPRARRARESPESPESPEAFIYI